MATRARTVGDFGLMLEEGTLGRKEGFLCRSDALLSRIAKNARLAGGLFFTVAARGRPFNVVAP
jgi:hypothetical protein